MPRHVGANNGEGQVQTGATGESGSPPVVSTGIPAGQADGTAPVQTAESAVNPPANTPPVDGTPPVEDGATPPASGDVATVQQGNAEGENAQRDGVQEETPNAPVATTPPEKNEGAKKRIECEALKGGKIIIGNGEVIQIDENGFFEVDEKEAERLLSIPGYKEA